MANTLLFRSIQGAERVVIPLAHVRPSLPDVSQQSSHHEGVGDYLDTAPFSTDSDSMCIMDVDNDGLDEICVVDVVSSPLDDGSMDTGAGPKGMHESSQSGIMVFKRMRFFACIYVPGGGVSVTCASFAPILVACSVDGLCTLLPTGLLASLLGEKEAADTDRHPGNALSGARVDLSPTADARVIVAPSGTVHHVPLCVVCVQSVTLPGDPNTNHGLLLGTSQGTVHVMVVREKDEGRSSGGGTQGFGVDVCLLHTCTLPGPVWSLSTVPRHVQTDDSLSPDAGDANHALTSRNSGDLILCGLPGNKYAAIDVADSFATHVHSVAGDGTTPSDSQAAFWPGSTTTVAGPLRCSRHPSSSLCAVVTDSGGVSIVSVPAGSVVGAVGPGERRSDDSVEVALSESRTDAARRTPSSLEISREKEGSEGTVRLRGLELRPVSVFNLRDIAHEPLSRTPMPSQSASPGALGAAEAEGALRSRSSGSVTASETGPAPVDGHPRTKVCGLGVCDITQDGSDELVICGEDGTVWFVNHDGDVARCLVGEEIRAFACGRFSLMDPGPGEGLTSKPLFLCFITHSRNLLLLLNVSLDRLSLETLWTVDGLHGVNDALSVGSDLQKDHRLGHSSPDSFNKRVSEVVKGLLDANESENAGLSAALVNACLYAPDI